MLCILVYIFEWLKISSDWLKDSKLTVPTSNHTVRNRNRLVKCEKNIYFYKLSRNWNSVSAFSQSQASRVLQPIKLKEECTGFKQVCTSMSGNSSSRQILTRPRTLLTVMSALSFYTVTLAVHLF